MTKIDIENRYLQEEEVRKDTKPYKAFFNILNKTFNLTKIQSFCDVGCATGHLMWEMKNNNSNIEICGYEFFEYHKNAAKEEVKNYINIVDLRDELNTDKKYDLVVCTEVGEHIDKQYCVQFLDNLKSITGKFLIMSWSDSGGENDSANDPHHQHLNPLKYNEFVEMMEQNGFALLEEQTKQLLNATHIPHFHDWWRKSLTIWKVKK